MVILADENIPFAAEGFGLFGDVRTFEGRRITRQDLQDVDILLVRSVTRVDASLLSGTPVRFVGSATIGTDHVDLEHLRDAGIVFACAPGSNAESVVEYVIAALLEHAVHRDLVIASLSVGVVGCGNIGGRLASRCLSLGMRVLVNDPPLADLGKEAPAGLRFQSLEHVAAEADVLTLHVPLTSGGVHPTRHMIDASLIRQLKPDALLINTARGAAVSSKDLLAGLRRGRPSAAVLDVFEGEPAPNPDLIERAFLATPHIAGYSYDGKLQGMLMLRAAVAEFLGLPNLPPMPTSLDEEMLLRVPEHLDQTRWLADLVRQMYEIRADDARLRETLRLSAGARAAAFASLRKSYPRRRTFRCYAVRHGEVPQAWSTLVSRGLRVQLIE